jgi:hypothetical protein
MPIESWPALPLEAWSDTRQTLHRWLQVVGKVRVKLGPWLNHSWLATLYVTPRGLSTSTLYHGERAFEIELDFRRHVLAITASDGRGAELPLVAQSVAQFYRGLMDTLAELDLAVRIHGRPNEIEPATPFAEDEVHRSYDPEYANRFWRVLLQADRVLRIFRARFLGKSSPVHFFWGSADLAVTRFSGRRAPVHPGGVPNLPDWITRDAYSHEEMSCGFWAGSGPVPYPAFYAYAYPAPEGFREAPVAPGEAFYSAELGEFILPYDAVRTSANPDETLLVFLQSTYDAAARLAHWEGHLHEVQR